MEGNKDDAVKCLRIGKAAADAGDSARAVKFLSKAKRLDPSLPIDHLLDPLLNQDDPPSSSASSSSPQVPAAAATSVVSSGSIRGGSNRERWSEREEAEG
ncbi:hypothetical protein EE612_003434 [Oryza sativa]|nr:hypothetical protein EE612_003434 [Oryza sativa]